MYNGTFDSGLFDGDGTWSNDGHSYQVFNIFIVLQFQGPLFLEFYSK